MGHGSVAEEIKRRRDKRQSMVISIEEEGVRFRSYADGTRALHGPRDLDGGAGGARVRHRARLRRVHALPRGARLHGELDGAHAPLARPLRGLVRRARARRPAALRHRAGRGVRGPARRVERLRGRRGRGRHRHRRLARPGEGADARGGRLGARGPARRAAAAPARHRRRGRHRARGGRGHRQLRLRNAHAPRAPRNGARARPRLALAPRPHEERAPDEPGADRRGLPMPGVPRAHARLPALPHPGERADREAAHHAAQPHLHGAADARPARGDRGRGATARRPSACSAGVLAASACARR